jgi:hypothetical protein
MGAAPVYFKLSACRVSNNFSFRPTLMLQINVRGFLVNIFSEEQLSCQLKIRSKISRFVKVLQLCQFYTLLQLTSVAPKFSDFLN